MEVKKVIIASRKATYGAPGTKRNDAWKALRAAHGSVDRYLKAGGPRRYLTRWASQGLITPR